VLLAAALSIAASNAAALEVGDPAPAFEAESTAGSVKLADYQGKKHVLLAFYYKDFTSG
jgi:peroxiredoxin Q/BCP